MDEYFVISSSEDRVVENADWVELNTLLAGDGNTSLDDLARAYHQAHSVSQDTCRMHGEDVFSELKDRIQACGTRSNSPYPFTISSDNKLLSAAAGHKRRKSCVVYKFLLLVSRSDMQSDQRSRGGIDPTKVFERLCADVLANFWGSDGPVQGGALVFGTAATNGSSRFSEKVDHLCREIGEGEGWKANARAPRGGDGGVDVVVWKRFSDQRQGGLISFAQCKTGENWRTHRTRLQPRAFCDDFMVASPANEPLRIYMIPHRISFARWRSDLNYSGLVFDRCRITECATRVSTETMDEMQTWLKASLQEARNAKS